MAKLNENESHCANCGYVFSRIYTDRHGYQSILKTIYCSKSCAAKSPAKTNKGCIAPDVGQSTLKQKALDFISQKGCYCTADEICKGIGHSSKLFVKHGLKTSELNAEVGMIKSKSIFQGNVGEVLRSNFNDVEQEKSFDGLVGVKGHPLRVDFYIPEINTVVEADGTQHSDPKHPWKEWNNGTVAQYGKIKDDYFEDKGIRLVRIPYKPRVKESDVLSRLV